MSLPGGGQSFDDTFIPVDTTAECDGKTEGFVKTISCSTPREMLRHNKSDWSQWLWHRVQFWLAVVHCKFCIKQLYKKLSWCWQTRATRLEVSQVTKHGAIPYVRYRFLLVLLSVRRIVFSTFDFEKCCDLEIRVRDHSWSLKLVPFDSFGIVSY